MKRVLSALVLLAFSFMTLNNNAVAGDRKIVLADDGNPKLEIVGGDTYDWGNVQSGGNPLKAKVQLKNAGSGTLKITEVKPGCGCTTAPLDKKELGPGDIGTMEVSLNPGGGSGPLTKSITITSNDASTPVKVLYLKANITRPLQIEPAAYVTLNDAAMGKASEAKFTIVNNTASDVLVTDVEIPAGWTANVKMNSKIPGKGKLEVVARHTPKSAGYINASFKIKTNSPDVPSLDMQVYGNVAESKSPVFAK